ncbi:MAG: hypothetical protein K2G19_10950, partial [Lachnospiraceae bacterium]|nr:hypothetical protein [Lachnospiraceae bacterium]
QITIHPNLAEMLGFLRIFMIHLPITFVTVPKGGTTQMKMMEGYEIQKTILFETGHALVLRTQISCVNILVYFPDSTGQKYST